MPHSMKPVNGIMPIATMPAVDVICLHGQEIAKVESHPSLHRNKRDTTVQVKTKLRYKRPCSPCA